MIALKLLRKGFELRLPLSLQLRVLRWITGYVVREFAWIFAGVDVALIAVIVAVGWADTTLGVIAIALLAVSFALMLYLTVAAFRSARTVRESLEELEPGGSPFPATQIWFPLAMWFARSVRRVRAVPYAERGKRRLKLDVYLPRTEAAPGELRPAVIQVHGGGWMVGTRMEQGIPLLNHLAAHGWVGFNIDYRLSPRATFPEHMIDVKEAIAWVRANADEYNVDPSRICITGGSAGGHLTALTALTANDPAYQPGFEDADTRVAAAVPFYGVYDFVDDAKLYYPELLHSVLEPFVLKRKLADDRAAFEAASPVYQVHPDAPPFLIIHGDGDTLVMVEDARRFVSALRETSNNPVLYAELRGAEHAFDLAPSIRTARIVEAIERFLDTMAQPTAPADAERQTEAQAV